VHTCSSCFGGEQLHYNPALHGHVSLLSGWRLGGIGHGAY
jgi:hypothetical protein